MERIKQLIEFNFKEGTGVDEICGDERMTSFVSGELMEIKIFMQADNSLQLVDKLVAGPGSVLCIRRKNKEKINPRKLMMDLYIYRTRLEEAENAFEKPLNSLVALSSELSSECSIQVKEILKEVRGKDERISLKMETKSVFEMLRGWKQRFKETLDATEILHLTALIDVFDIFERDYKDLVEDDKMEFHRIKSISSDFCANLFSLINNEPERCPSNKDIKYILNAFVGDLSVRTEKEVDHEGWWDDQAVLVRVKQWQDIFQELKVNLSTKVSSQLFGQYQDPQLENQLLWIDTIIGIHVILKEGRVLGQSNKFVQDEINDFLAKLRKKDSRSLTEIYKELKKSELLVEILKAKRRSIQQVTKSSQTFNSMNFLVRSSQLLLKNDKISSQLSEEKKYIESKMEQLIKEIDTELAGCEKEAVKFHESFRSQMFPKEDRSVSLVKDLVAVSRKYKLINRFVQTFFEGDKALIKRFDNNKSQLKACDERIQQLVTQWDANATELIRAMKGKGSQSLIELDVDSKILTTNFSEEVIVLLHMMDSLSELGLGDKLNKKNILFLKEKRGLLKEGIQLKNISTFYNSLSSIESFMLPCHKPLLIDQIVSLEDLINNTDPNIENMPHELHIFMRRATEIIASFEQDNSSYKKVHSEVIADFSGLLELDLINSNDTWKKTVRKSMVKVQGLVKNKPENYVKVWTNELSWQLLKVLAYQIKINLLNISSYIPKFETTVKLFNNRISLSPNIPTIRSTLYSQIDMLINFPRSLQFFDNWNRMIEYLPNECNQYLSYAYSQIDVILRELELKTNSLRKWIAIANLDSKKISENRSLNTGEIWRKIVETIKQNRRELERQEDFIEAGCIRLKISNFKFQIEEKLTALLDGMLTHIDSSIHGDKQIVEAFLVTIEEKMNYQPKTADELREAWDHFDSVQVKMMEFNPKVNSLEDKIYLIKTLGRVQSKSEEVLDRWRAVEGRIRNFQSELKEKQEFMKTEIVSKSSELKSELEKFNHKWESVKINEKETLSRKIASEYMETLRSVEKDWTELRTQVERVRRDLNHFGLEEGNFELFEDIQEAVRQESQDWRVYSEFEASVKLVEAKKHVGNGKNIFELQDLLIEWQGRLKSKKTRVEQFVGRLVEEYQTVWPGLKLMIGESFQREHWNQLMHILTVKGITSEFLTLGHILEKHRVILQRMDELKELSARAQGEVTIREAIQELDTWCATAEFELMEYLDVNKKKVPLIKEWTDMMAKVGDNQSLLQSIKDSKFFLRFKDRIVQFDKNMGGLDRYLAKINNVQRRWLYLEPIFNKGALPSEKPRFQSLNEKFTEIMRAIEKNKKIAQLGEINGLETSLNEITEQIEMCQSALNQFLEETRNRFPRFFFLGDDDLLEILGQSDNPSIIKLHLKKIFAGIFDVEFSNTGSGVSILSMISSVGESVPLKTPVKVESNLEVWLSNLEKEMLVTLQESLLNCLKDSQMNMSNYSGQIISAAKEIDFSHRVLDSLEKNKMADLKKHLEQYLESLTNMKSKLSKIDQTKVKGLIMDVIHQLSVADELLTNKVTDSKSWYWFKQLKYFLSKKTKLCQIMMCKATFDYTYEYQGNPGKLVHTPLTDKCYLTLTQGMMLGFGGNPYGPAGTGKTESVKALGQAMARMVLVFNCDENLDYKSMGRIFIGLVKCGAWGCFDEFNRLIEEQLSAISQQIQVIQDAIREKRPNLNLLGNDLQVNYNAGIFVTLNPAGKGYGGRSKLPDNLKLLFRPVAMSRPDNELIAEVMLFSEGFKQGKRLAKKIVSIFQLSNQLLSKQQHYDWGLRALKTILTASGDIMELTRGKGDKALTSSFEDEILLKALNDNTASKLTSEDLTTFYQLVEDVMPGVKVPDIKSEQLIAAIEKVLLKSNYEIQERQMMKIIQFHAALSQRMGVVIMGPSGSGKTTIWSVLKEALNAMGVTVKVYIMNPKAISRSQLLGYMDPNTREFHNGVLTAAARKVIKEPPQVLNWIICDGDVDPKWIEALNSVLDDNHLLTLPTGERIAFGNNVNFIFETHDLKWASPATVSRMGMIYLNNDDVNVSSLLSKWKKEKQVKDESQLNLFLKDYFEEIINLISRYEEHQIIRTTRMGSILTILSQVKDCENKKKFSLAAMRGIVSNFRQEVREDLIAKLEKVMSEKLSFLSYYDDKQGSVNQYKQIASDLKSQKDTDLCVLTPSVQANQAMIGKVLESNGTVILVGPEGGGKNTILKRCITNLGQGMKVKTVTVHCNSQTSSSQIIAQLQDACVKATSSHGPILRPKDATRLIIYLRDINLAKPDEFDSIELISFLQQMHSHRGFYDEELEFINIDKNIQFVVSMNPSSDIGRHEISTRLTACTNILFVDYPSKEDMKLIFKDLVELSLNKNGRVSEIIKSKPSYVDNLTTFLLEIFTFVKTNYLPDTQKHYTFTPKDISNILESLKYYEVENTDEISFAVYSETNLTFRNRLVKPDELSKYDNTARKIASQNIPFTSMKDTIFSAFIKKDQNLVRTTSAGYVEMLQRGLISYQREHIELDFCFTDQIIELVQCLDKVISRPGGKAMLIGQSGSARKLATHFACFMLNVDFETCSPGKNYSQKEFRKELRRVLEVAGFQGKKVCLYLENHHIIQPSFMEDINSLLASNQVQGLFRQEEVESALKDQINELRDEFFGESVYECFLLRIKKNLRAVFSLDPNESMYIRYLTNNPALLKKCKIIWVQNQSSESLRKIATSKLEEFFKDKIGTNLDGNIVETLIEIHRDLGDNPRMFFSTIECYKKLLESQLHKLKSKVGHLDSGVNKITEANKLVDELSEKAGQQKANLKIKQSEAESFLQKIQQTYESASDQKREAEEIKQYLKGEESKTMDKRLMIEKELDKVAPTVENARKQVGSISKAHINELKSYPTPPPAVDDVFTALFKLSGEGDVSWNGMKKALSNSSFLSGISNMDARCKFKLIQ
jgi:dynein heavy chain 2